MEPSQTTQGMDADTGFQHLSSHLQLYRPMVFAEAPPVLVVARAWIDCIGEQTVAELILLADTELAKMEADTDNSNYPLGNSESFVVYCVPDVRE